KFEVSSPQSDPSDFGLRTSDFRLRTSDFRLQTYRVYGFRPMATMLQATIGWISSARARAINASLSAPGFTQTSAIPLRAISSITSSPISGGTYNDAMSTGPGTSSTDAYAFSTSTSAS